MKILLATTAATLNGGGIGSYNMEFYNIFKDNAELHLLSTEDTSVPEGYTKFYALKDKLPKNFKEYKELVDEINNENYDIIFNSDSSELAIVAPFVNSPIVSVSHTFNNLPAIRAGYNHRYQSKIIALSKAGKRYLERKFNVKDTEKITYLYNFVHHDSISSTEEKQETKVLNIVYPGGAIPMKYPEMIAGAVNLLAKTDLDFNFYWYGNDVVPLKRVSIPKRIKDLVTNDKRVHMQGKVSRDESQRIIDSSNIFLLPSRAEGCPVSLMEAMCTGCIPIVGDGKHVCREILEDGNFGVIVKKGSSKELFNAIVDVIKHHDKYKLSYQRSLDYSNKRLSENVWRNSMLKIFSDALKDEKQIQEMTRSSFMLSKFGFEFYAMEKILEDRLLSLKVYIKFNFMYLKYKLYGVI